MTAGRLHPLSFVLLVAGGAALLAASPLIALGSLAPGQGGREVARIAVREEP